MTTFNFRGLPDCFVRMIRFFVLSQGHVRAFVYLVLLPCHMPRIDIDNCPLVTTSVAESAWHVRGVCVWHFVLTMDQPSDKGGGNGWHWQGSSQHALCYRSMSSWYHQPTCVRCICLFVAGKTEERHFWRLILMWNIFWDFFLLHQVKYLFAFINSLYYEC